MSDALAAALLMSQRRRVDPNDSTRKYGQYLLQQGSSVAPVHSTMEGLARALQGGVGGLVEGMADQTQRDTDTRTQQNLASVLGANTPEEMQAAVQGFGNKPGDMEIMGPVMAQMIAQKQEQMRGVVQGQQFASAVGGQPASPQVAGSPAAPPDLPGGTVPAGSFANNTGNIRATPGVSFPGQGAPQNGFMTFDTPQSGVNAQRANLGSYVQQNPNITVAQAISKWAPPSENNTDQYIRQVAEGTGINPGMPLAEVLKDPAVGAQLMDAMTRKEKGGLPQGVNADTFMAATGGQPQPPQGPQIAQGDNPAAAPGVTTQVGDSSTSTPPVVPRPKPTPDQVSRYQQLVSTGKMTIPEATTALNKEIVEQWNADKDIATKTWQDQQQSKRMNEQAAINLGQKAPMELISQRMKNYEEIVRPKAESAVQEISGLHQVRQLLDQGAFTGMGADAQAAGSRLAQSLGIDLGTDQQANTAALSSAVGNRVLSLVKNLGSGTGISNADREYAAKIAGGKEIGEPAMRKILDIGERAARATIKMHDTEAQRLQNVPGVGQLGGGYFGLQNAPTYEEWNKANPPIANAPLKKADGAPQGGGNIPVISDPAEAAKLPSGTAFIRKSDGKQMWVP